MSLATFRAEAKKAASIYAERFGLTPEELEYALIANASLEGGLGEEPGVGDGGASVGRYQFNTDGGHGSTLINQGYTRDQIAKDEFAVDHWAPILAGEIQKAKASGLKGGAAIQQAIFNAERPAAMYPSARVSAAFDAANQMTGAGGITAPSGSYPSMSTQTPGGGATTPSDTTTTTKPATNAKAALDAATAALNELIQNQPGFDDLAFPGWSTRVDALQKFVNNLTTQAGLRDTTFANTNTQFSDKLALDTAAQNNAQNSITNFLNGAGESRARATLNLDAQKLLQTWGTPEGKSSYTPDELGSSFANTYRQAGLDPTRASLNYTGTVRVNPGADLAAGDAQFGAGGPLPTLPKLNTSASDIPGLPQSPEWPSAPSTTVAPRPLPPGYGATAGLGDAERPNNNPKQQLKDAAGRLFTPWFANTGGT